MWTAGALVLAAAGLNEFADSELVRFFNTLLNLVTITYLVKLRNKAREEIAAPVQQLKEELLEPHPEGRRSYDPRSDEGRRG